MLGYWLFLILLIFVGVVTFIALGLPEKINTNNQPPISCAKPLNQLPSVTSSSFQECYLFNSSSQDGQRYYDTTNDWTVVQFDSPQSVPGATQVCQEFCDQLQLPTSTTSTATCTGQGAAYNNCISQIYPTNCTDPAVPVAVKGADYFYVVGKGKVSCYPPAS